LTADQVIRLVGAIAQLLGVLVWPAVVLFLLLRFRVAITEFLGDLGEFSLKAPGVEASAKRQRDEAAVALGAAVTARTPAESDPGDIAEALPGPRAQRRLQGSRVLWVDDRPDNNRFERQALEAFGIRIDLSRSTEDAVDMTLQRSYDLIISDMGRPRTRERATHCWTGSARPAIGHRSSFTPDPARLSTTERRAGTEPSAARIGRKN